MFSKNVVFFIFPQAILLSYQFHISSELNLKPLWKLLQVIALNLAWLLSPSLDFQLPGEWGTEFLNLISSDLIDILLNQFFTLS